MQYSVGIIQYEKVWKPKPFRKELFDSEGDRKQKKLFLNLNMAGNK